MSRTCLKAFLTHTTFSCFTDGFSLLWQWQQTMVETELEQDLAGRLTFFTLTKALSSFSFSKNQIRKNRSFLFSSMMLHNKTNFEMLERTQQKQRKHRHGPQVLELCSKFSHQNKSGSDNLQFIVTLTIIFTGFNHCIMVAIGDYGQFFFRNGL